MAGSDAAAKTRSRFDSRRQRDERDERERIDRGEGKKTGRRKEKKSVD